MGTLAWILGIIGFGVGMQIKSGTLILVSWVVAGVGYATIFCRREWD